MRVVSVIFWKEFKSYFLSPVAYVVLTGFTALSGFLFYQFLTYFIRVTSLMRGLMVKGQVVRDWTLVDDVMSPLYRDLGVFLVVMVPAITMRLFAEEKKLKTEELLLTSPVRMGSVVLGKYLAAIVLLVLMLLPVGVYLLIVLRYGTEPDAPTLLLGYAGLFLIASTLAAIGVFASTLTENQIIAFFVCAVLGIFFFIVGMAGNSIADISLFGHTLNLGEFLRQLSLITHFSNLVEGRVEILDITYFASLICFFLLAALVSAESARRS